MATVLSIEMRENLTFTDCIKVKSFVSAETFASLGCHAAQIGSYRRFGTSYVCLLQEPSCPRIIYAA